MQNNTYTRFVFIRSDRIRIGCFINLLSKSSNCVFDFDPPSKGGNSNSSNVGRRLLEVVVSSSSRGNNARCTAIVANLRNSPCTSHPMDADLSNGDISFGNGVKLLLAFEFVFDVDERINDER